ncbi:MAG TPA: PhzF family phenazine biosynthesis isomerase [Candidatus Bathyarchaeia archaeon]|nr:PhzF family phenazine biosynthesis isomerase [Candidatus Bathyarchaeia archaeon]
MSLQRKLAKQLEVKLVDVFTTEPFQGNPILVVPYGDSLSNDEKLAIIHELNTEKGVFIGDANDGKSDFSISVLSFQEEIDSDYQSLIAAAFVMITEKNVILKDSSTNILTIQTRNGVFPIIVNSKGRESLRLMIMMNVDMKPEFRRVEFDTAMTAESLGLVSDDIRTDIMIQATKMKHWAMIIPMKTKDAFDRVVFNRSKLINMATENNVDFICLFYYDSTQSDTKIFTRIFHPKLNGDLLNNYFEDMITGESNCSIATFLFEHKLLPTKGSKLITAFNQKTISGRQGEIFVEMDIVNEYIKEMCIGGDACLVLDGKMKLTPY